MSFHLAEEVGADPDRCAAGRWQAYMLLGDYADAWRESDAIRSRCGDDLNRFWNGEEIGGKRLMLRCLHGLGDAVQMLRYLPMLQARCNEVTVEVPPRMLPLAPFFAGASRVITWGEDAPIAVPEWDVQVEVMELPYLFRSELADLPIARDYLKVREEHAPEPLQRAPISGKARAGIVWAASEWDATRRLPLEQVARLAAVHGIEFWNLQGGDEHARAQGEAARMGLRDAAEFGGGLVSLAAAIASVDLVITVDTLAAHLAGALGKPAWVLLQHKADWRWMHDRSDSPWYPSLRLFRQPAPGDWAGVADTVSSALLAWRKAFSI